MVNSKTFTHNLKEICPEFAKCKFLLAVSGGVDSMVLLSLFKKENINFEVAHLNYNLREKDSVKDLLLVEKVCLENKVPLHLYNVNEKDKKPKNSIQEWARNLRYDFFKKIKKEQSLDFIVTAHHLNDQLETFIINLSKASGIKGLSGIPANENEILRPLLSFSKDQIYFFAKENNIEFREDLSNQKNDYLRNEIRNEIVPQLLKINDHFLENFGKSLSFLKETRIFVDDQISKIEKEIVSKYEQYITIESQKFFAQSNYVQFEILRKFGFENSAELDKIRKATVGKIFVSAKNHLTVDRNFLIIKKLKADNIKNFRTEIILEVNSKGEILLPELIKKEIQRLGNVNWKIDSKKINLPLKLRKKKTDDYIFPVGMNGKKKISKFYKDEKISNLKQENIWILSDTSDEVLGILPYRQDRRILTIGNSEMFILHL